MNVLFVEKRLRTDKLGPMYLASVMREAGHTVNLVQDDLEPAADFMRAHPTDAVLFSVMSPDAKWSADKCAELKGEFDFISVSGGPHPTFFPSDAAEHFDRVIVGPGEKVICDVLDGTRFAVGPIPAVNSLPMPARDIQYRYPEFGGARMKRFIAGRYCLYSCTYCFNHQYKKLYPHDKLALTQRTEPERMLDEVEEVRREWGLELAYFNDDDIASDPAWLADFCARTRRAGIAWCGSIRASSVGYGSLKLMRDSGCTFLNIALESAREETQKFLRRGRTSNKQVLDACRWAEELGIKVRLQNMIGLPVADPLGDALDTLAFNQEAHVTDSWAAIFQPYTGTDLWHHCVEHGLLEAGGTGGNFFDGTPLAIPDRERINRLYHWWPHAVKHNLPVELVRILLDLPIPAEIADRLRDYRYEQAKGLLYGM